MDLNPNEAPYTISYINLGFQFHMKYIGVVRTETMIVLQQNWWNGFRARAAGVSGTPNEYQ